MACRREASTGPHWYALGARAQTREARQRVSGIFRSSQSATGHGVRYVGVSILQEGREVQVGKAVSSVLLPDDAQEEISKVGICAGTGAPPTMVGAVTDPTR
jgi:hypothetical protein